MALTAARFALLLARFEHAGLHLSGRAALNVILQELCQNYDLDTARGTYVFTCHPGQR